MIYNLLNLFIKYYLPYYQIYCYYAKFISIFYLQLLISLIILLIKLRRIFWFRTVVCGHFHCHCHAMSDIFVDSRSHREIDLLNDSYKDCIDLCRVTEGYEYPKMSDVMSIFLLRIRTK